MAQDLMRYDLLVEGALRAVVREAMSRVAADGLPGEHHLYITFRTDGADVRIPDHLREKYTEEMTIVLQHQFENLQVDEAGFSVSLSFNDIQEKLRIPYAAITAFADPSANFGLQFKFEDSEETESGEYREPVFHTETDGEPKTTDGAAPAQGAPSPQDNVVTLDTFRKK
jgi:hypothetical protein